MEKYKHLTDSQRQKIKEYKKQGYFYRKIASLLNVRLNHVYGILSGTTIKGGKERRGNKITFSDREKRAINTLATKKRLNAVEIKSCLSIDASVRTVQRYLKHEMGLKYGKFRARPTLSKAHKNARVEWAEKYVDLGQQWNKVIFSDEKKFNLDGPDGYRMFWYGLGADRNIFSKRQNGGGGILVWAAFSEQEKAEICRLEGRQDAQCYIQTLESNLLPLIRRISPKNVVFQQDNCPIHTAKATIQWLQRQNIDRMSWPSYSPDLNPMENLWAVLARRVYAKGRQFQNKRELMEEIKSSWQDIDISICTSLVTSMKTRCVKILKNKGEFLKY